MRVRSVSRAPAGTVSGAWEISSRMRSRSSLARRSGGRGGCTRADPRRARARRKCRTGLPRRSSPARPGSCGSARGDCRARCPVPRRRLRAARPPLCPAAVPPAHNGRAETRRQASRRSRRARRTCATRAGGWGAAPGRDAARSHSTRARKSRAPARARESPERCRALSPAGRTRCGKHSTRADERSAGLPRST
jgi:hypothetical protein